MDIIAYKMHSENRSPTVKNKEIIINIRFTKEM